MDTHDLTLHVPGLKLGRDGPIGWLVFENPGRLNALTPEMVTGLETALPILDADADIRVVVMRGAGTDAFIAGGDLGRTPEWRGSDAPQVTAERVLGPLRALNKPLIAMIHGWCLGGGLLLALPADIRIAADDARFGIPAARIGVGYSYDATEFLIQLVGPANTAELLLTAERFGAAEALRMGLINRVVPKAELEAVVIRLALGIADNAPLTIKATKQVIRTILTGGGERDVALSHRLVAACFESEDFIEGPRAFAEKRKPRFTGR